MLPEGSWGGFGEHFRRFWGAFWSDFGGPWGTLGKLWVLISHKKASRGTPGVTFGAFCKALGGFLIDFLGIVEFLGIIEYISLCFQDFMGFAQNGLHNVWNSWNMVAVFA